jgi:cytidylate kinase
MSKCSSPPIPPSGPVADPAEVLDDLTARDQRDRTREHSPLLKAPDAVELDTTGLTVEQVVSRIVDLVRAS